MKEIQRSALVPYTPAQMFSLVEDVERYAEFLPWVTRSTLLERNEREVLGRLEMERAGLRESFTTRNTLSPPNRLEMQLVDGPFRVLEGSWVFTPIRHQDQDRGTRIDLGMRFEFKNPLTSLLLSRSFEASCSSLVDAFVRRARELYGTAIVSPSTPSAARSS